MGVINVTITESSEQTVIGIPDTISVSTNEPALIFYTLDGCDPTTYSPIYLSPIVMPQNLLMVTLKVYATNQIDTSSIIAKTYTTDKANLPSLGNNVRQPRSGVLNANADQAGNFLFPFGQSSPNIDVTYENPSQAATIVYNQSEPATSSGFDADGNPAGFTNKDPSYYKFKEIYSTKNSIGEIKPGVGNLPAKVTVIGKTTPVEYSMEQSSFADKLFNPKALVIYQDSTTEDPTNPVHVNRANFSLEKSEIVRDGDLLFNSGLDAPPTTGSFISTHYNQRTNMMTSYFYDNTVGRWIISSYPYQPTVKNPGALSGMVFGRSGPGSDGTKVYKWVFGKYRTLV